MNYIFIDRKEEYDLIGIVEENNLLEFYIELKKDKYKIGNIFRGRVDNISKSLDAAFIDIGHKNNGFLYVKDSLPLEKLYDGKTYNIEELLKVGENKLVQILKEPYQDKGASLTRHITIPGQFLVLTPYSNRINVSKKIDRKNSYRLRKLGEKIQIEDLGFILRTNSKNIEEEIISEEYNNLVLLYKKIEREENFLPTPKLIYEDMKLLYRLIGSNEFKNYNILVNNKELYRSLMDLEDNMFKDIKNRLLLDKDFDFKYNPKLYEDLSRGFERKILLDNGGYIFIDKTEAMTVIDVNSGYFDRATNLNETIYRVNKEAGIEIARQIRLRNITGIIIIDFIDFRDKSLEEEFLKDFNKELLKDSNKANIISITKLGLLELTRKKDRDSDIEYYKKNILNKK